MTRWSRPGRYRDVCFPISKEFREKVNEAVLDAYRQAREKAAQEGKERTSQQMQNGGQEFMQYRGELLPFRQAVTNNS